MNTCGFLVLEISLNRWAPSWCLRIRDVSENSPHLVLEMSEEAELLTHCVNEKQLGKLQFTLAASLTACQFLSIKHCRASEGKVSKHLAARL